MNRTHSLRLLATDSIWGIAVLRLAIGIVFIAHGGMKLFSFGLDGTAQFFGSIGIPFPYPNAVLATFTELLGGIALVLGLFTRLWSIPLGFTMIVAFATVHGKNGFFLPDGYEFVFTLFAALIALGLNGSGALSLDRLIGAKFGGGE